MIRTEPIRTPETIITTILGWPATLHRMATKKMDPLSVKDETYNRLASAVCAGDFAYPLDDDMMLQAYLQNIISTIIADAPMPASEEIKAIDQWLIHAEVDADQMEREIEILRITQHIKPGVTREIATLWLRGMPLSAIATKLERKQQTVIRRFDDAMSTIRQRFGCKETLLARNR